MGTKDRILSVSLDLFNSEPDRDHSALDVANALEISPGNLYYHFKGKDAIIAALFDRFEEEMAMVLTGSDGNIRSVQDLWVYTYIILEEIFDFRFFYRNLDTMLQRYPTLARRFRVILGLKRKAIDRVIDGLIEESVVSVDPRLRPLLSDQILMTVTFWLGFEAMQLEEGDELNGGRAIHQTVYQIMTMIVPYAGLHGYDLLEEMHAYYASLDPK